MRDEYLSDDAKRVRAGHLEGLLDHAGWEYVTEEIEAEAEALRSAILGGIPEDRGGYVRYMAYCARLKALMHVLQLPEQLIRSTPAEEGSVDDA